MVYGVIYRITNILNGKIYFGQTKSNPPSLRWNRHKYSANKGCKVPIHCAIALYGIDSFKFEIECYCDTLDELNKKEIELISKNNTFCPNGYNIMKGGDNYEKTDEHKQKIANSLRGKKKTPEQIEKIKIAKTGRKIKRTKEHNEKISKAHLGKKKPQTPEHTAKIVKALTGRKNTPETIEKNEKC